MSIRHLSLQIEGLRSEMIRVAEHKGSLLDPQVVALSQQLDQLLVAMQKLNHTNSQRLTHTHWSTDARYSSV